MKKPAYIYSFLPYIIFLVALGDVLWRKVKITGRRCWHQIILLCSEKCEMVTVVNKEKKCWTGLRSYLTFLQVEVKNGHATRCEYNSKLYGPNLSCSTAILPCFLGKVVWLLFRIYVLICRYCALMHVKFLRKRKCLRRNCEHKYRHARLITTGTSTNFTSFNSYLPHWRKKKKTSK
jgi:hypothetical protein